MIVKKNLFCNFSLFISFSHIATQLIPEQAIALHEITHAFGFSASQFGDFWDGSSKIPLDQVFVNNALITPLVLAQAKRHFGCNSVTALAMEDQGGQGTASSHWEKQTMNGEYMIGEYSIFPSVSNFTLSLFKDSGWYEVDFTYAQDFQWGYNQGCGFLSSCDNWNYGCTENAVVCTVDRISQGICINNPPDQLMASNCRYTKPYSNEVCLYPQYESSVHQYLGETWSLNSLCFSGNIVRVDGAGDGGESILRCLEYFCRSPTQMTLKIDNIYYDCPYGSTINADRYSGSVTCPLACEALCRDANTTISDWPIATSVSPSSGVKGTTITITGKNFTSSTKVIAGGVDCDAVFVSSTQLTATIKYGPPPKNTVLQVAVQDSRGYTAIAGPFTMAKGSIIAPIFLYILILSYLLK